MGSIPFAFSVQHFINSVGADAGFASIIGLAILVLLYFAQARETAALRDQAYQAAQRADQLEGRLAQLSRSPAAAAAPDAQPAPAPAAAVRPLPNSSVGSRAPAVAGTRAPVMAGVPAAPAGVGAPALTAATRLIPGPIGPPAESAAPPTEQAADVTTVGALPPATAAGGANGANRDVHPPIAAGQPPTNSPRAQIRAAGAPAPVRRAPAMSRSAPARERSSGAVRLLAFVVAALVVAGVVAALLLLTGGSGQQAATSSVPASNAPAAKQRAKAATTVSAASVTVAVLNGTASSGLAHRVSVKLGGTGFKQGTVATASDQTRTATVVAFMPGHRRDALAVASALKLGPASVQPVDQNTQAVACPPPSPCSATVVVTVGSDLSSTP